MNTLLSLDLVDWFLWLCLGLKYYHDKDLQLLVVEWRNCQGRLAPAPALLSDWGKPSFPPLPFSLCAWMLISTATLPSGKYLPHSEFSDWISCDHVPLGLLHIPNCLCLLLFVIALPKYVTLSISTLPLHFFLQVIGGSSVFMGCEDVW